MEKVKFFWKKKSIRKSFLLFVLYSVATILAMVTCGPGKKKPDAVVRRAAEKFKTSGGEISFTLIKHASLVLTAGKKTVYMDPSGPVANYRGLPAPDLIIITHSHGDHLNPPLIKKLTRAKVNIVAPKLVAEKLAAAGIKTGAVFTVHIMKNGDRSKLVGVDLEAVPMYNLDLKRMRHKKGVGNGYLLTMAGARIYISGDTEDIPEMRALKNIDIAFVCMNLPYTMTAEKAASAVLDFKPKAVYPFHYRGRGPGGTQDPQVFKRAVESGSKDIEVRLRDWYPK